MSEEIELNDLDNQREKLLMKTKMKQTLEARKNIILNYSVQSIIWTITN